MTREAAFRAHVQAFWHGQTDPAHDIGHLARVWHTCQSLARHHPEADLEILEAAAWLHDLVNLPKSAPNRAEASRLSAKAAVDYLKDTDFPPGKGPAVAHAIEAHSFSAGIQPRTIEARILQDSDRIEALGAIGLARCLAVSGALGRTLFDPEDPLALNRPLNDQAYALDHFETKLLRLSATMQTEAGRALAEDRTKVLIDFRDLLLSELQGSRAGDQP
jgi:uncharacterized protein